MNIGRQHILSHHSVVALRATLIGLLLLGMAAACGNQATPTGNTSATQIPATAGGTEVDDAASPTDATSATAIVSATARASSAKPKVVATFSILGDLVENVGGDLIDLRTLVPAGGDAHTFEPSPTDSAALVDAAVIFENGLAFESWLPDLYTAAKSKAPRVVVTEGIEPIAVEEGHDEEHDEHADKTSTAGDEAEHDEEDEHGEYDPHTWHDVNNVIVMVEHIRDGLAAADPANAASYQRNATNYVTELKTLDSYVVEQTGKLPAERRKLVTTHDTFAYFARRYGFEIVGTALGSVSTEVADPSAAELVQLIDQIKATGVGAIFAENVGSGSLMERVANEAGVSLGPSLYTDALDDPGTDGDTYVKMIRYNIDAIVTALGT